MAGRHSLFYTEKHLKQTRAGGWHSSFAAADFCGERRTTRAESRRNFALPGSTTEKEC